MSWLFSQALVEEYSEENSLTGEQYAQLNVMPTQHKFLRNDKTIESSNLSRFGLTCEVLTESCGEAVLTSFLEAFPVRTYPQPEKAPASPESEAGYGANLQESFARYDRDSHSWKTHHYLPLVDSTEYLGTWPKWGMMQDGVCSEQTTLEHLTSGSGSGLWATPNAQMQAEITPERAKELGWIWKGTAWYTKAGVKKNSSLTHQIHKWPTPCARDWKGSNAKNGLTRAGGKSRMDQLPNAVVHGGTLTRQSYPTPTSSMMTTADMEQARFAGSDPKRPNYKEAKAKWATPNARDWKGKPGKNAKQRESSLPTQVGEDVKKVGQLDPRWVEWLMGWPINWTLLKPLNYEHFKYWKEASTAALYGTQAVRELWWDIDPASTPQERGQVMQRPQVLTGIREEISRVAVGVEYRADRLKAIGNGQVPLVAATAWRTLNK